MAKRIGSIEIAVVFILSIGTIFALTYPAQGAYFHWVDDHLIAGWINEGAHPALTFLIESDRFRPLYWTLRFAFQYPVFANHIELWRAWNIGMNATWMALLYAIIRRLGQLPVVAAFAVGAVLLYPQSSVIFYRLGPQEIVGNVLITGAVFALVSRRLWVMVFLAGLAGLYKESYVVVIPSLLAWAALASGRRAHIDFRRRTDLRDPGALG